MHDTVRTKTRAEISGHHSQNGILKQHTPSPSEIVGSGAVARSGLGRFERRPQAALQITLNLYSPNPERARPN